ncbi:sialate O-acetylesterase [Aurantiacibacter spongiae]|uniref:Sialate O-acetylesterase n=2 Tax=Aurantiacibacter spongiae TaxID=2488860 RepID=A0A3N5CTX7_9SPHN|nr:sialate O-acetylesterase [Aurantiacibacter spongiae]
MVLQRDLPIEVAGNAEPGSRVEGTLGDDTANAQAGPDGRFRLTFSSHDAASEPMTLTVSDPTGTARLSGVLVGDVYLCSGQSNMELPVVRALNVSNELRMAGDEGLRLLQVPKVTASTPVHAFGEAAHWQAASGDTAADFSAACFYMGKQLRADHPDVPVGLIHSSWGGSAANAWLSPEGVRILYGEQPLARLRQYDQDPLAAARSFAPEWYDWYRGVSGGSEPWKDSAQLDWRPIPKFSFWNEWTGTGLDTNPNGLVWLRQTFTLTPEQAASAGSISIGAIDDLDMTFVNGAPVGYTFGWGTERTYRVPAADLKAGKNEVLIAAWNAWDTGGFYAGPDRLFFSPGDGGDAVPLGADWDYAVMRTDEAPPRAPWDALVGTGVMHNAMIAPIGPMRVKGVAWYQGEADVGQPGYADRLRELFAGWRRQFGDQARMMVVQLAGWGTPQAEPVASGWAELRQQQLDAVVADDNAALVAATDLGEPTDIHPANKNVLGKRLAMAAEGEPMPMPDSAVLTGDTIRLRLSGVEGGLRAIGGPYGLGVELCGEMQESCRFVLPALQGDTMLIRTDQGGPVARVRHAWSDAPLINLYDERGLPVPGFELPVAQP